MDSFSVTSLAVGKSCDCSSDGEVTVKDMPYTGYIHDMNSESHIWIIVTNQRVCISVWCTMQSMPDLSTCRFQGMETLSTLLALCQENHRSWGFPSQRASNAHLCCFLWCQPEQALEQTEKLLVIWDTMKPMVIKHHCNECCQPSPTTAAKMEGISISWPLTHWGWVMHICVNKLTIIGLDNGLLVGTKWLSEPVLGYYQLEP